MMTIVLFTSGPPFLIDGPRNQTINESDTLLLTCNVGGNPAPNISWYRHDSDKELATGSALLISHANRSHAGSYRCIASNGFGNPVTSQATVLINCKFIIIIIIMNLSGLKNQIEETKAHGYRHCQKPTW